MKKFLCICLFGIFSSLTAADFVVGTATGYAPFVSLDERGEYVGFDIDLANVLAKKLDRKLVIKDFGSMPSLFLALKQNKVDALMWAISITKERQEKMEMIYYQGAQVKSLPLIFWKNVRTLESLANDPKAQVCVEAGSFQDSFLQSIPNLKLKHVDKVMDCILELKYGKSQATMIDPSLVAIYKAKFPELAVLEINLPESMHSFGNGICVSLDRPVLIKEVKDAVQALQQEGAITTLEEKWGVK